MPQFPTITPTPLFKGAPACEKCDAPLNEKQGWCGRCGWYPRLGTYVELDPWEREAATEEEPKPLSKLQALRAVVPVWGRLLLGGVVLILLASIAARVLLPKHGSYKFVWTIAQMVVGAVVLFAGHLSCYLFAALENERLSPIDIFAKPFTIWFTVAMSLPATFWRIATGVWGLSALSFAVIVGGFSNRDLLDWGGTPARMSLVKAISSQAEKQSGDFNNLEDAIEAAAKQADTLAPGEMTQGSGSQPQMLVDCLIIGFEPAGKEDFSALVLAAADNGGKLRFVGTVSQGISPEQHAELFKRMQKLVRPEPFIPCGADATWLKPALTCRIGVKEMSSSFKLVRPVFKEMLNDISVR